MKPKKRLVVFDFDGVIVEDCRKRNSLVKEWGIWKVIKMYLDDFDGAEKRMVEQKVKEIGLRTLNNLVLKPDVDGFINFLHSRGCKKAILSLNSHYVIEYFLDEMGLLDKFDIIYGIEDVRWLKPYPEGLIKIMLATGVTKDKTLYIGDSILDTIAGFLADVDTVKTVQEAMVFPY